MCSSPKRTENRMPWALKHKLKHAPLQDVRRTRCLELRIINLNALLSLGCTENGMPWASKHKLKRAPLSRMHREHDVLVQAHKQHDALWISKKQRCISEKPLNICHAYKHKVKCLALLPIAVAMTTESSWCVTLLTVKIKPHHTFTALIIIKSSCRWFKYVQRKHCKMTGKLKPNTQNNQRHVQC